MATAEANPTITDNFLLKLNQCRADVDTLFNELHAKLADRQTELLAELDRIGKRYNDSNRAEVHYRQLKTWIDGQKTSLENMSNLMGAETKANIEISLKQTEQDCNKWKAQIEEFSNISFTHNMTDLTSCIKQLGAISVNVIPSDYTNNTTPLQCDANVSTPPLQCDYNVSIPLVKHDYNVPIPLVKQDSNVPTPLVKQDYNVSIPLVKQDYNAPIPLVKQDYNVPIPLVKQDSNVSITLVKQDSNESIPLVKQDSPADGDGELVLSPISLLQLKKYNPLLLASSAGTNQQIYFRNQFLRVKKLTQLLDPNAHITQQVICKAKNERYQLCLLRVLFKQEDPTTEKQKLYGGVEFEKAVGDSNGTLLGTVYFKCKPNYGLFLNAEEIFISLL